MWACIIQITYNLYFISIMLIKEIMMCVSNIIHDLLLFVWMLLLAELPKLLSEMWILFNRVIEDLRCGALVRRLVEFNFVDLLY